MGRFRVQIKPSAQKDLLDVATKKDRQRLVLRIEQLADDPRPPGCQKLASRHDWYRVRQGQYRIVYEIRDDELIVLVIRVGQRRDVYRGL